NRRTEFGNRGDPFRSARAGVSAISLYAVSLRHKRGSTLGPSHAPGHKGLAALGYWPGRQTGRLTRSSSAWKPTTTGRPMAMSSSATLLIAAPGAATRL